MTIPDFDSGFCGTIPLNRINHIQDYGALIVTDMDLNVTQVSENIGSLIGIEHEQFVNTNFTDHITAELGSLLHKLIASNGTTKFSMVLPAVNGKEVNMLAVISVRGTYILIELESHRAARSFIDAYQQIREAISAVEQQDTYEQILTAAADALKKISGFDKVMIYQFDEKWNGNVVAEAMEPDMESYLGLVFPASDIPKQARDLYQKNPYRLIPNQGYNPIQLYPLINPLTSGFVDVSTCNIRGVAKVHTEYLKNMNVCASMSTRIMKDNKLWGLISCHHRTPFFINFDECLIFELISNILSARLSSVETKKEAGKRQEMQSLLARIIESIYSENTLRHGVAKAFGELMSMFDCNGIAYIQENNINTAGQCPGDEDLDDLLNWLQAKNFQKPYVSSSLSADYPGAENIAANASGIVAIPVISENREFLIGFRGEVPQFINWGGNPNEAVQFEEDKVTYHPRNSFKIWKQSVQNTSFPFTASEQDFANDIHRVLLNYRLMELSNQL